MHAWLCEDPTGWCGAAGGVGNSGQSDGDPASGDYAAPAFRSIAWRGRYLAVGFALPHRPRM